LKRRDGKTNVDPDLRARLFGNDTEAWNDERYLLLGGPILGVLGVLIGAGIAFALGLQLAYRILVYAVCAGLAIAIGLAVLAVVDVQHESTAEDA
jgi:hypothetical protein